MKFISSEYDSQYGESMVIVQHFGKKFHGFANIHPAEKEKASTYAGCQIAEIRAEIKALKYERKLKKAETDTMIKFVHACECYKYFNKEENSARVVYRQLNRRISEVNKLTDEINKRYKDIDKIIRDRSIIIRALDRYKSKKEKQS